VDVHGVFRHKFYQQKLFYPIITCAFTRPLLKGEKGNGESGIENIEPSLCYLMAFIRVLGHQRVLQRPVVQKFRTEALGQILM
jgi:hypothetical protein